jgi:hypothetical protein
MLEIQDVTGFIAWKLFNKAGIANVQVSVQLFVDNLAGLKKKHFCN